MSRTKRFVPPVKNHYQGRNTMRRQWAHKSYSEERSILEELIEAGYPPSNRLKARAGKLPIEHDELSSIREVHPSQWN